MAVSVRSPSYTHAAPGTDESAQSEAIAHVNFDDESEYEYEYDEEETEDFYFTLDLTTHVPDAIIPKEYAKNGKRMRRTAEERREASEKAGHPITSMRDANADDGGDFGALQFVGLDTKEPYVKFNSEFFSCSWYTDVGTQLWISHPGVVHNPRMAGHVLDVIGSSQVRLVGKPATLRRKHPATDVGNLEKNGADRTVTISDDEESGDESFAEYMPTRAPIEDLSQPLVVPRHRIKDPHSKGQAEFMERFSALKIKRGEMDAHAIPMKMPVFYKGASNPGELRKAALAADATSVTKAPRGSSILRKPGFAAKDIPPTIDPSLRSGTAGAENFEDGGNGSKNPPAMKDTSKHGMRSKDGPKGGAPSREAIRIGLGLGMGSSARPKGKPGRPSQAELASRRTSELTGAPSEDAQPLAQSAAAQEGTTETLQNPDTARSPAIGTLDGIEGLTQPADVEGDDISRDPESAGLNTQSLTVGSNPEDASPGAPSNRSQPRFSATPSIAGSAPHVRAPSEPAATPGSVDNTSRRNSHASQNATPAPNASGSAPKPKRPRRTDAEMYAAQVEEARLRGEPTPPARQRKKRRTPAEMADARRNQERLEAEQVAAAATTTQEYNDEGDPATPATASIPDAEDAAAAPKQRNKRRTPAEMAVAGEAPPPKKKRRTKAEMREERNEQARKVFMTPGAVPVEMEMSFDGAGDEWEEGRIVGEERARDERVQGSGEGESERVVLGVAVQEGDVEEQAGDGQQAEDGQQP